MPPACLYVSDLDGTLLNRRGELSGRSREGVHRLLEEGVLFTVASARSYFSIRSILGDLPFSLPIIEFNGAFMSDYSTGRHLLTNALAQELSQQVLEEILRADLRPFVSTFDGQKDRLYFDELINEGMRWYEERRRRASDPRLSRVTRLDGVLGEEVVSLTVMAEGKQPIKDLEESLHRRFGDQLRMYRYENEYSKGTWWLTIHHPRASKHYAVQALRDQFAPGQRIVAFGDNYNDLAMLRAADEAIAVENAVPELKQAATSVIGSCDDDCVVNWMLRFSRRCSQTGAQSSEEEKR